MLRTIETIGYGSRKCCYLLDNGQVALCADPYDLRAEHKALQRLREVGLPTFQTELKEVLVGDTEPLAEDPQFLYDDDGEVVLCDPETVFEDGERSAKMVQSYIDMYLKDIQDLRLL